VKTPLIIYPHGIGDTILLTPALKAYHEKHGVKPAVAIQERFKGTGEVLKGCPYVGETYFVGDPWDGRGARERVRNEGYAIAEQHGYAPLWIWHPPGGSKIAYNMGQLGAVDYDTRTEVFSTVEDKVSARDIIYALGFDTVRPLGFYHVNTGVPVKDIPEDVGDAFFAKKCVEQVIKVGWSDTCNVKPDMLHVNIQIELLCWATHRLVPDSLFFHAGCARGIMLGNVYFAKGVSVHERVKPLSVIQRGYTPAYTLVDLHA